MVFPRRPVPKIVINTPKQLADAATPRWRKIVREGRRPRYWGVYVAGLYLFDHELQDDAYQRTIRTLWTGYVYLSLRVRGEGETERERLTVALPSLLVGRA
jgi:hypothetical protein